jgi:hypothetical protein
VTALDTNALVEVNGNLINCSVILHDLDVLRLGGIFEFVFHGSFVGLLLGFIISFLAFPIINHFCIAIRKALEWICLPKRRSN